ncbi:penicillin-binding transpeptidase domain-containing protein [Nonomuraea candida]|uniref:penicillin-binding transpeptidase domain-containing protein n=1 Tax=Nonomuraea candida TaxID=359159 RepID=UPI0005BC4C38|nr:penicillin-binding transpeptidase domain-containing protein [Nonomuraea candida]
MAGSRGRWLDVPLRRVARVCAAMLFVLLAHITLIQAFGSHALNADRRNERPLLDRHGRPRGDIVTYYGTPVATSRPVGAGPYRYRRVYPHGELYAAVTGYASLHRATGIEHAQDPILSGNDAKVRVRSLIETGSTRGAHVRLTVRDRVQRAAYEGLRSAGLPGAAVAIDPATGAVLALATWPTFDPNALATLDPDLLAQTARRLRQAPAQPLLNRALNQVYPPGSTFKLVTAAAALASGEYTPSALVDAPARLRLPGAPAYVEGNCGGGRPTLAYAFQTSCDTAFATIGLQLGQDLLRDQAEAFGFNAGNLRIPLPTTPSRYPLAADRPQTALAAIGHHDNRVTPLMVAMLSAAVANDGVLMRPHLVAEVRLPDGSVINRADPAPYRRAVPPELARHLAAMMTSVSSAGGMGAAIPGVRPVPKAAASEEGPGAPAVVTAFAPTQAPEVAVGVVLERPGERPDAVSTIARSIIEAALS